MSPFFDKYRIRLLGVNRRTELSKPAVIKGYQPVQGIVGTIIADHETI
jgi:hypothetical protein